MADKHSTRIIFIRHGHVHNPQNVIYGRLPGFRLSAQGMAQAQAAAQALRAAPLAAIFSSPLLRAQQTAESIAAYHPSVPLLTSELIHEIHIALEGQSMDAAAACDWDFYTNAPPGYEQPADLAARAQEFIAKVRRDYAGQTVAAVTHGDVLAFTCLWAAGLPLLPAHKHTLDRIPGFVDDYPQPASLITLHFMPEDTRPSGIEYLRPYGAELLGGPGAPK